MKKQIMNAIFVMMIFVSLAAHVSGLGVAPARSEMFYESLQEIDVLFKIINNEQKELRVTLIAKGELAQYVTIEENVINIPAGQYETTAKYKINFPVKLPPGEKSLEVWVLELADQSGGNESNILKANIAVVHKLIVHVPYPDQYLEGILFISEAKPNEKVSFTISLSNLGSKDIRSIKGRIIIKDGNGQAVSQSLTNEISLDTKGKSKVTANWIASEMPGTYTAQAIVEYDDGKIITLEKSFDVGEPLLEIESLKIGPFKLGTIARFDILIRNKWNQNINNVFGLTEIRDKNNQVVNNYKTASVDIPAGADKEISSYWDTKDVTPGDFSIGIRADYLGRVREKTYELSVKENEIIVNSMTGEVIGGKEKSNSSLFAIGLVISLLIGAVSFAIIKKNKETPAKKEGVQNLTYKTQPEKTFAQPAPIVKQIPKETMAAIERYIDYNMRQGISIHALKQKMLEKGYDEDFVDSIILKVEDKSSKII